MNEEEARDRYRRDFTRESIRPIRSPRTDSAHPASDPKSSVNSTEQLVPVLPTPQLDASAPLRHKRLFKRRKYKKFIFIFTIVILAGAGGVGGWYYKNRTKSPVPTAIQQSINFPIYYPDSKKLPTGYSLDTGSFSKGQGAVIYKINYGKNQHIIVSVQQKPSDQAIKSFDTKYIPLHTDITTAIGTAKIGAIDTHAVVSLPTSGNSWLLMTAPSDINQNQLKQVIRSIKKP